MSISLYVTSDLVSSERRISLDWTIATLKAKLEPITGIPPSNQQIVLYGKSNDNPTPLVDEDSVLERYNPVPFGRIHVEDTRPPGARENFTDPSAVEKYIMPDSQYESRSSTVLQWKKEKQLGRFDPTKANNSPEAVAQETQNEVQSRNIKENARCKVVPGDRLGTVRYVGVVPEIHQSAFWVGVEFDEPTGKNDGTIQGKRYFDCKPNYGSFLKPSMVEIGDFAVQDEFDDDDDEL